MSHPDGAADAVQHQVDDVPLAALDLLRFVQTHAHCSGHGTRVDHGKPAQRDDAEQKLCRLTGRGIVQAELDADSGERLLAGGDVVQTFGKAATVQRLALDQADEVGSGGQEVEVVGDSAGEDRVRTFVAGERTSSAGSNSFA